MPNKPLRPCTYPGCNILGTGGRCARHKAKEQAQYEAGRGTATERGYNGPWHKVRGMKLAQAPLCERCAEQGRIVPAALVHHIKRIKDGGSPSDPANLLSLCDECHDREHKDDRWKHR